MDGESRDEVEPAARWAYTLRCGNSSFPGVTSNCALCRHASAQQLRSILERQAASGPVSRGGDTDESRDELEPLVRCALLLCSALVYQVSWGMQLISVVRGVQALFHAVVL